MIGGSEITVKNLFPSKQGDKLIIETLKQMGADITWDREAGIVTVRGGRKLKAITFDAGATPDLVPTVAVLAAVAEGTSRIVITSYSIHYTKLYDNRLYHVLCGNDVLEHVCKQAKACYR